MENILITKLLGREPLAGIKPGPKRFKEMFELAETEMRRTKSAEGDPEVAVRVMDKAA
jgi:hypothetical protein